MGSGDESSRLPGASQKMRASWSVWSVLTLSGSLAMAAGIDSRIVLPMLLASSLLVMTLILCRRDSPKEKKEGAVVQSLAWGRRITNVPSPWIENAGLVLLLVVALTTTTLANLRANRAERHLRELESRRQPIRGDIAVSISRGAGISMESVGDRLELNFVGCQGLNCEFLLSAPGGEKRFALEPATAVDDLGNRYSQEFVRLDEIAGAPNTFKMTIKFTRLNNSVSESSIRIRDIRFNLRAIEG